MVIGIGGCSNSGKSGLAKELASYYTTLNIKVLCQDDFVKRRDFLTKIDGHVNWELPTTIIIDEYISSVNEANNHYDIVICEGLFAFWFDELNILYDKKIYIEIDKATFKQRKQVDLRWGKEPDWYIEHIWESHLHYGQCNLLKSECSILNVDEEIRDRCNNYRLAVNYILD